MSHDGGAFGEFLEDCEKAGAVAKWAPITSLGKISNDEEGILIMDSLVRNSTSKTVYVGTPCMASAPGHLLARMKDSLEVKVLYDSLDFSGNNIFNNYFNKH